MANFYAKPFSREEITEIYEKALYLLEQKGIHIDHVEALKVLEQNGAVVDRDKQNVKFPRHLIEESLKLVPKNFVLAANNTDRDLNFSNDGLSLYARPNTGAPGYIDVDGNLHRITIADVAKWTKLVTNLKYIDFVSLPSTSDIDGDVDVHTYRTVVENTDKHIWIQPYSKESIKTIIDMAAVISGSEERLKKRPIISMIACSLTPLAFKEMDVEVIWQCSKRGIPIHASSLPTAGGTSPFTTVGTILLASMEILAQLVMAQIFKPGTPVIANGMMFHMDMRSGGCFIHNTEAMLANAGFVHFFKEAIGIPAHTYGFGTDSNMVDEQSFVERSMNATLIALAGASILGGAGQLEVATAVSPLQLIIDDEISMILKRIVKGIEVNEDNLALEEIMNLQPGGNFVQSMHTLKHCRDNITSTNFIRLNREMWKKSGSKSLLERVKDRLNDIMSLPQEFYIDEDTQQELDGIIKRS